jgi:hypothetical protein
MMTLDQVKQIAPSVFATSAKSDLSNKYVFVPTMDIMENFVNQGWELSSVKQNGKGQRSTVDYDIDPIDITDFDLE